MAERTNHDAGRIEARVCEEVNRFLQHGLGRGASTLTATLCRDALFVHLRDVLTPMEKRLATGGAGEIESACTMVREMRDHLVRRSRSELAAVVAGIVGRTPVSVLHDLDPATGDEVIAFLFGKQASEA